MTESDFIDRVDRVMDKIEHNIEESGLHIGMESTGNMVTLTFGSGNRVMINAETPVRQIWVVGGAGGCHFDYDDLDNRWIDNANGEELFTALSRICTQEAGKMVQLT